MAKLFQEFYESTFPYKSWNIKDTYVVTPIRVGNWWPLKKYIVLYIDILVNRNEINLNSLQKILQNFEKFVSSFPDGIYKEKAYKYFLEETNLKKIIPFDKFNDLGGYEDLARKFYFMRIMNIGGQAGLKKDIKGWLDDNKSMSEIIELQDKKKDWYISQNKSDKNNVIEIYINGRLQRINGIIDRKGKKVRAHSTMSDFPASISRNQRQVYSKWGFLPPERDGITSNQISELIYHSVSELELISICDHQKFKLREGNPQCDEMINYGLNLENEIKSLNLSKISTDFNVSPFIALIEILNELSNYSKDHWYISESEYQFIISRMSPFNLDHCIKLILDFRKDHPDISSVNLDRRKKRRNITSNKVSGGFKKPLTNLLYGYLTTVKSPSGKDFRSQNTSAFLTYISRDQKFFITNIDLFNKYFDRVVKIKKYLNDCYQNLYRDISDDYQHQVIDEFFRKGFLDEDQVDSWSDKKEDQTNLSFVETYLRGWSQYMQNIDLTLFKLVADLNSLVIPYSSENITFNENKITDHKDSSNIQISSYSTIKSLIARSGFETLGLKDLRKDRKEFNRIKLKIKKDRMLGIFHRKEFNPKEFNKCDACKSVDKKGLDLHHIIPHEINGPDVDLNLVYLCKNCHKKFTFNTKRESQDQNESRITVINRFRIRRLINRENFQILINEGHLTQLHLDFLFTEKYISFVEWMDLRSLLRKIQKEEGDQFLQSDRFKINNRWNRSMKEVFEMRVNNFYINGKIDFHYPVDKCDGGCNSHIMDYVECHHVIPKSGSNSSSFRSEYGSSPLNGPESEFNYLYLCKECHSKFTHHTEDRKKIIQEIRNRGLINYQGLFMMICSGDIGTRQLTFLYKEGFINHDCYDNLLKDQLNYQENELN
jgi:5-methylcytosine-specific restriction endonuclease McrA